MKSAIDKEFFEEWKDKYNVMWCEKEEYAKEFCRLMHENGFKWVDGQSYLEETAWDIYKEETVYEFKIGKCCNKDWYDANGYTILNFEDYIVKEKMTKQELVKLMVDNFSNKIGYLDLSGLDFSEYDCNVDTSRMKVAKHLYQEQQDVKGDLYQEQQDVKGDLYQGEQKVGEDLFQGNQMVKGDLSQGNQTVKGELFQGNQNVGGDLLQYYQRVNGSLYQGDQKVQKHLYQECQNVWGDLHQDEIE